MLFLDRPEINSTNLLLTPKLTAAYTKHWPKLPQAIQSLPSWICIVLIETYRMVLAPVLGGACRFEPSCSVYAIEAFKKWPFQQAFSLSIKRLSKCRPGGTFGTDPVPDCECKHG